MVPDSAFLFQSFESHLCLNSEFVTYFVEICNGSDNSKYSKLLKSGNVGSWPKFLMFNCVPAI